MIRKNIKERIKEYFFLNPTERLRIRQVEKKAVVPLPSAIKYVKDLEKEGILKKSIIAGVSLYSADRISNNYRLEKMFFNIRSISDSKLVDYLISEFSNPTIIIFGSYSKGEDTEMSDIDIYIETSNNKNIEVEKFEKLLKRKIQIFRYKSVHDVENREVANSIINGITLNGFIEVL